MKKIVFYNVTLLAGGIEKAIEALSSHLYKDYEIDIVYTDESKLDNKIVSILSKYAKVYKLTGEIECDVCIWCRLYFDYELLKSLIHAKKYIAWIHSKPRALENCLLDNTSFVNDTDEFICVSETLKNNLRISKEGKVFYNFITQNIESLATAETINRDPNILNLVVVSRLSEGKGFDRLHEFVKELDEKNIPFKLHIVGNGRKMEETIHAMFSPFNQVEFVGYKENPYPYIKNADYLLQLSDYEAFCISVTEAKSLGTPCVLTSFESSKEQVKSGFNGLIIPLEDKTYYQYIYDIIKNKEIYKNNLKGFVYEPTIEKWKEVLQ